MSAWKASRSAAIGAPAARVRRRIPRFVAKAETLRRATAAAGPEVTAGVADILARVRSGGDAALRELTARLDGAQPEAIEVSVADRDAAAAGLTPALREAISEAAGRIRAFHEAGMQPGYAVETAPGVVCERVVRLIRRVGLYVPGGLAPLVSSVPRLDSDRNRPGVSEGSPLSAPVSGLRRMIVQGSVPEAPAAGLSGFSPKQAEIASSGVGEVIAPEILMW